MDMSKSLQRRAARVSEVSNEAKKRKVLAALRYLVDITPVDTSKALSNWQVSVGTRPMAHRQALFPGVHGSTQVQSADTAYLLGVEALKESKAGWPVYLSNLAPYIKRLNEGSSRQHPGGFVDAARTIIRVTP